MDLKLKLPVAGSLLSSAAPLRLREYAKLQLALALRPDWGKVIPGDRGKRGGLRVVYYWQTADDQIWLLVAYPKSERDDLSHDEIKQLKRLVEEFEL